MIQMDAEYLAKHIPLLRIANRVQVTPTVADGRKKVRTVTLRRAEAWMIQRVLGGDPAPLTDEPLRGTGYLDGWPFREEM